MSAATEDEAPERVPAGRNRRIRSAPRVRTRAAAAHAARNAPYRGGRQRAAAAVLSAVFLCGLLGQTVHAAPSPQPQSPPTGGEEKQAARDELPDVFPRPQSIRAQDGFVPVSGTALLVADEDADPHAVDAVRKVLREAGAETLVELAPDDALPTSGTVVRLGADSARKALASLRAPDTRALPSGGYRLAVGEVGERPTVALDGAGADGLFHGAQTLRQLLTSGPDDARGFPGAVARDWPTTAVRGSAEAFYGNPWTHEERLDHVDFLGRTKQNRFLYASGDDPYRKAAQWRAPYPQARRAEFRRLADRARRNHVVLGWAVSPGQSLCFSSDDDRKALLKKLDAMRALGVEAFQLRFEDVSYSEWHCDDDADAYGSGPEAAARAQAELADDVAEHLRQRRPEAPALSVMPTEYYQEGATAYRTELADKLDRSVEIAWTGVGVVPRTITGSQLATTRAALGRHPVVTMDDYPVNDWARDRIFLGPYTGRDPAVASGSAALLSNAMEQPRASRIPLFTAADFAWNPRAYRADDSWRAAIDAAAGGPGADTRARAAVRSLARNDASSELGTPESAHLAPLVAELKRAYRHGDQHALEKTGTRLRQEFGTMHAAPGHVPEKLADEVAPWLRQLARYGEAGEAAVRILRAQAAGDGERAWQAQLELRRLRDGTAGSEVTVGKGVLKELLDEVLVLGEEWAGAAGKKRAPEGLSAHGGPAARPGSPLSAAVDGDPATAYRASGAPTTAYFTTRVPPTLVPPSDRQDGAEREALMVELPKARALSAVTVQTGPRSGTRAEAQARVVGEGWKRLGTLADSGWTQLRGRGVRADALRLVWSRESSAPVVHDITPWYADAPGASLSLPRSEADAAAGGGATRVSAELTGNRPGDVTGKLRAEAPKGIAVRTPKESTVRRGSTIEVPLEISADASVGTGTHRIPLAFGRERRTLTLRTFPESAGPDLAAGAEARSSANETDGFPASALTDGKRGTRWSSPAEDGAWVQVTLEKPARIARAVLHWQDAHAERYRVRVSPDGKRWHTAATVRGSEGGKEQVRMDAPADTRYVRIQGDERATEFGYSLWSLRLYAAAAPERRD
ncbi:beta-N-acetylglucosaminidase domain-containing protein [Streptomyces sulphureus]|uniref:beta-N-acetylglucosaminidase domain-containing protein n=1 Tax=Streptomyces sulphureus TaxID=47758 RepID=UPI000377CBF8|nr:beta-N-acetylglucosaminidase domain-containing protein [Streptomyces sulphureus]